MHAMYASIVAYVVVGGFAPSYGVEMHHHDASAAVLLYVLYATPR